jgi:predicted dehydrogenase
MKTVNIAMLGSGFVATFYMQGLQNVNGQQVVINYSRTPKRAKAFAREWGIAESTTDLDRVIARDDIDLFIIFGTWNAQAAAR